MSNEKFDGVKYGDKIRIVIESDVTGGGAHGKLCTANNVFYLDQEDIVSVEVITPVTPLPTTEGSVVTTTTAINRFVLTNYGWRSTRAAGKFDTDFGPALTRDSVAGKVVVLFDAGVEQ